MTPVGEGSEDSGEVGASGDRAVNGEGPTENAKALASTRPARKLREPDPNAVTAEVTPSPAGLDRYKLLEEVGQGGMAVVYRAHDTALDREVAVKVLHPHLAGQAESRDRLEREAQAVAKLRHENILEIFDYSGRNSKKSFIVTEFIHGTTLRGFMNDHPLPHPELAELIVSEIARALEHAHQVGIIHRDIKPENVMIRRDGVIKLTDFGIAQMIDRDRMTVTGQLLGSPAYMAPEHVEGGGIDFRTDVFALGILLYQLATGELPFRGKNPHEVLKRIADCQFTPADAVNPRVGRKLAAVIQRALAKEKNARFADIGLMRRELIDDLGDAGLLEPRVELTQLFADPPAYVVALGPRLVDAFAARGRALRAAGRVAAALELWRRALEIEPRSGELLALVAGTERRRRMAIGAAVLGVGGAIAATAMYLVPTSVPVMPPVVATAPVKPVVTAIPATAVAGTVEGPNAGSETPQAAHPHDKVRTTALMQLGTPRPTPTAHKRSFELVPTPKAVRVLLDGVALGDYGPQLQAIEVDGQAHTVTFDSPFCYPETVAIEPGTEPGRILRRLKWRPATLTVRADPADADVLIDDRVIARSGHAMPLPIPPLSDGRRTVKVTVSSPGHASLERELTLRANEIQTLDATLHPTGTP